MTSKDYLPIPGGGETGNQPAAQPDWMNQPRFTAGSECQPPLSFQQWWDSIAVENPMLLNPKVLAESAWSAAAEGRELVIGSACGGKISELSSKVAQLNRLYTISVDNVIEWMRKHEAAQAANGEMGDALERISKAIGQVGTAHEIADAVIGREKVSEEMIRERDAKICRLLKQIDDLNDAATESGDFP